jgi:hypothetical protein
MDDNKQKPRGEVMIHESAGTAAPYYSVDLDQPLLDGTRWVDLSTMPLEARVARLLPNAKPRVDWHWTKLDRGRVRVWFRRREHAETFERCLPV